MIRAIAAAILNGILWGSGYLFLGVKRIPSIFLILGCFLTVLAGWYARDGVFQTYDLIFVAANLLISIGFGLDAFKIAQILEARKQESGSNV